MRSNSILIVVSSLLCAIVAEPIENENIDNNLRSSPIKDVGAISAASEQNQTGITLVEKAIDPHIFYTPFSVVCPTEGSILAMDPDPNVYQKVEGESRPVPGGSALGKTLAGCLNCACDPNDGTLIPSENLRRCDTTMLYPEYDPEISLQEYQEAINAIPFGARQRNPAWGWQPYPDVRVTWDGITGPLPEQQVQRPRQRGRPRGRRPKGTLPDPWIGVRFPVVPVEELEGLGDGSNPWRDADEAAQRMLADYFPDEDPWAAAQKPAVDMMSKSKARSGKAPKLYRAGDPRGWAPYNYWDRHPPGGPGSGNGGGMGGGGTIMSKRDVVVEDVGQVDSGVAEGDIDT
ncbi:hypothetical protein TWF281_011279 [Arthrobotrys megalospora]